MKIAQPLKAAAIASIAALVFAACGSDGDDAANASTEDVSQEQAEVSDDAVVFDFTEQSVRTMPTDGVKEITFKIHPEVVAADQDYAHKRALESVTVSSWDGGASQCGVELRYEYATGAKEELNKHTYHSISGKTTSEFEESEVKFTTALGGSARLGNTRDSIPTQDFTLLQKELDCAVSPADDNHRAQAAVEFRSIQWVDTGDIKNRMTGETEGVSGNYTLEHEPLAEAKINIMANGDLHIAEYDLTGWTQDSNGDWIPQD